jgi:hypothetical protein
LTHAILASFQWKPDNGHHNPLKRHLELHYTETTLCEDLFGKQQQPRDWSLETELFLFSLRAFCKQSKVVAKAFEPMKERSVALMSRISFMSSWRLPYQQTSRNLIYDVI